MGGEETEEEEERGRKEERISWYIPGRDFNGHPGIKDDRKSSDLRRNIWSKSRVIYVANGVWSKSCLIYIANGV